MLFIFCFAAIFRWSKLGYTDGIFGPPEDVWWESSFSAVACSVTSGACSGLGFTDTSSRFFSAPGSPALPPARPNFLLDNCCTFREEPHGQQKAGKNLTAQNLCVVTDVQSSERFQCALRRDAERWGNTAESQHRRAAHETSPASFDFWSESSSEGAVICAPQASGEGEAGLSVLRILER